MQIDPKADRAMTTRVRRKNRRGPWLQLLSQVVRLAGDRAEIIRHCERPWSSVTFSGARHTVVLAFTGVNELEDGDDFIAALPDHEFTIPRQIVADATITAADQQTIPEPKMTIEAELLLLEEA